MAYKLEVRPLASSDIRHVYFWYEEKKEHLGQDFMIILTAVFNKLSQNPSLHSIYYKDLRMAVLERFPYSIFYFIKNERISILRVLHQRRNLKKLIRDSKK
jgi:plasmid stabilization system protein ParE